MKTSLLSHELQVEFPDLAERVSQLSAVDARFASLFARYGSLDGEITRAEQGGVAFDDFALEEKKKQRVKLKDELYQMLRAS
jgi:uncharacterized protein YdcH (DUF465 family)